MLNMDNLQVFVMAAETENFSRAAQQLHMSQPAVSQQIQSLEQHLGVELFERNGRRISLSAAGQTLLPKARDLIRNCRQVEEAAMALAGEVTGHLSIGCSTASGKYLLPRLLAQYREQYPLVRGTVRIGGRASVIEWLSAGEVDLAVTSERVQRSGLHFRRFFQDEIVLIVPRHHPWATRENVQPEELYGERFILREASSGTHLALLEGLDQVSVDADRLETVLTLGNAEAIVIAVEEGIGLGFVPNVTANRCMALGRIQAVPVENLEMRRWLYLVNNSQQPQTPALQAFWKFVDTIPTSNELTCPSPVKPMEHPLGHSLATSSRISPN